LFVNKFLCTSTCTSCTNAHIYRRGPKREKKEGKRQRKGEGERGRDRKREGERKKEKI
jgi:hypothetical protein